MKKLKPGNRQKCSFCFLEYNFNAATMRSSGIVDNRYSCDAHKPQLSDYERTQADDGHMSEGEYQATRGRF